MNIAMRLLLSLLAGLSVLFLWWAGGWDFERNINGAFAIFYAYLTAGVTFFFTGIKP